MSSRLLLKHCYALGDSVLLTALCRDIQLQYPGQFELLLDCHYRELFDNNPNARVLRHSEHANLKCRRVDISYREGIAASNRGEKVHMLGWYYRDFNRKMNLNTQCTQPRGDLNLSAAEMEPMVSGRYWVVMAGGKLDNTVKIWRASRWQQTVDALGRLGVVCVQTGAVGGEHTHPKLTGVVDLLGKCKGARQFAGLIAGADGVICPITGAMHLAAVFKKPCVVLAGGRESPWWEHYGNGFAGAFGPQCNQVAVPHRFLHTVGQLDCCRNSGCWKHRTVKLNLKDPWDRDDRLCKLPVIEAGQAMAPACLDRIEVDHVLEAVMSYYEDGTLPPIGDPKRTYAFAVTPLDHVTPQPLAGVEKIQEITPPLLAELEDRTAKNNFEPQIPDPIMIDHPLLGGKLTVFVLCYGPHFDLAQKCIGSILNTVPANRIDLRVGLNAVDEQTRRWVNQCPAVTKVYDHPENARKYPVMREMFNDPNHPITTPYLVWFDDDTSVIDRSMWSQLCQSIIANHPQGCRLYGWPMVHDLAPYAKNGNDPYKWFKTASWWKGRNLYLRTRPAEYPNGSAIHFVPGWFWGAATDMIREGGIPDKRLQHNGGDICIGEVCHQLGYRIKSLNVNKGMVFTPPKEAGGRRGWHEAFPWTSEGAKG